MEGEVFEGVEGEGIVGWGVDELREQVVREAA